MLFCNPFRERYHHSVVNKMIRQMFLVILACASLVASSVAACACSHHVQKITVKNDCHGHNQKTEAAQAKGDVNDFDKICICFVGQQSPYIASRASGKDFKSNVEPAKPGHIIETEIIAVSFSIESLPDFISDVSYSSTLSSLLPSRAPPRL